MKIRFILTVLTVAVFGAANLQAQDQNHLDHDHGKMEATEATFDCPMKCEGDKVYHEAGECPECGMALTKHEVKAEAKTYYCPMKCEGDKTYEEKGKCPKCGMALVKTKDEKPKDDHKGHSH